MTPINLNNYVWVQLTGAGWEIYDAYHSSLGLDSAKYRLLIEKGPEGYQRFHIWNLMEIFGPHTYMGMGSGFFEKNNLWFSEPVV